VTDLKGKKVGYNYLSPSDILMSYALHKHGLSEQDIISTNIPADSIQSALESARINAGATYEPNVSIIKSLSGGNKYHDIFSSKEAPGLITDTLVFRSDFIQQNPQAVTGVIKGFLDGLAYMNEHPDEAAKIISMMTGTPVGSVAADLKTVYLPSLEEMPNVFKQSADISSFFSSGKLIGELLQNKQAIKSLPKIEDTFDASFVDNLLKAR
jgi:NitT/TauT family transport system substrate-binding protein